MGPLFNTVVSYLPGLDAPAVRRLADLARTSGLRSPHDPDFRAMAGWAGPGALVLDVGANRGQSIRSLRRVMSSPRIVAVEPNPRLARYLTKSFPDVAIIPIALGRSAGEMRLHVPRYGRSTWDTRASTDRGVADAAFSDTDFWRFDRQRVSVTSIAVTVKTVDELELVGVDVIKIDTEGTEVDVVAGGQATIERDRPLIMVEGDGTEVAGLLTSLDYGLSSWNDQRQCLVAGAGSRNSFLVPRDGPRLR